MTDAAINSLRYHATVDHTSSGHTHVCHICARYFSMWVWTCYDPDCRPTKIVEGVAQVVERECPDCHEQVEDRVITEINRRAAA